jgi:alkylresorcinol/alkylpyrone synthase
MGGDIKNDGFGVVLSPELPQLLRRHLRPAVQDFLEAGGMSLGEFNGFLFHPKGVKVHFSAGNASERHAANIRSPRRRSDG